MSDTQRWNTGSQYGRKPTCSAVATLDRHCNTTNALSQLHCYKDPTVISTLLHALLSTPMFHHSVWSSAVQPAEVFCVARQGQQKYCNFLTSQRKLWLRRNNTLSCITQAPQTQKAPSAWCMHSAYLHLSLCVCFDTQKQRETPYTSCRINAGRCKR